MTHTCLSTATTHVVTNDFWLEYSIAGEFTVNLEKGSMMAQENILNMLKWHVGLCQLRSLVQST